MKVVAQDFAGYFKQMTGALVPIVTDENTRVEKEILIGPSKHVSELMVGIDLGRMDGEEYLITTVDSSLILTGGKRRGTPNAVYTFLDEILGCRWYEGFYAVWTSIQRWAQAAEHIWIWSCGDFFGQPFHPVPMRWENWTKNLRQLRDLGIEGMYCFAMATYYHEEWMQPLRAYLLAKTMWDPDRDPWEVIEDFASGYYGPAVEVMLEYIRQTQDLATYQEGTPQWFMRNYLKEHPQDPSRFHQTCEQPPYVKPDTVHRWEELFDMAEKKAGSDKAILKRIAVDRLSVDLPAVFYLEPDDPVRKTASRRLLRVLGQLFGEDYSVRCPDGKRRPLKEASQFFKSSKPLVMEK